MSIQFTLARPIPFALQGPVEKELNKLVKRGVLEPVAVGDTSGSIFQK